MESNQNHDSYRFAFDDDRWLAHLEEKGFVVVAGFVTEAECKKALEDMKKCIACFSPKLTEDEETWTKHENYPFLLHGGMVQYVGHANFQWDMREKVAPIFAKIWNCEVTDLATSFDGFCYMNGKRGYEAKNPIANAHTDQSPLRDFRWSIQGLVNLCDSGEDDGGLVVVPKSHKYHKTFMTQNGSGEYTSDWYRFTDKEKEDPIFSTYVKICGKEGDFMMWDSRTFHCNTVPTTPNTRAAVYVCEVPKAMVPEEAREQREIAWQKKRCSSHQPGNGFRMFPTRPRGSDPALKDHLFEAQVTDEYLSDLQKSLLCFSENPKKIPEKSEKTKKKNKSNKSKQKEEI